MYWQLTPQHHRQHQSERFWLPIWEAVIKTWILNLKGILKAGKLGSNLTIIRLCSRTALNSKSDDVVGNKETLKPPSNSSETNQSSTRLPENASHARKSRTKFRAWVNNLSEIQLSKRSFLVLYYSSNVYTWSYGCISKLSFVANENKERFCYRITCWYKGSIIDQARVCTSRETS